MSVEMAKQKIKQIFNREIKHWKNGKVPYNAVALIREDVLSLLKDYVVIPRQKLEQLLNEFPKPKKVFAHMENPQDKRRVIVNPSYDEMKKWKKSLRSCLKNEA